MYLWAIVQLNEQWIEVLINRLSCVYCCDSKVLREVSFRIGGFETSTGAASLLAYVLGRTRRSKQTLSIAPWSGVRSTMKRANVKKRFMQVQSCVNTSVSYVTLSHNENKKCGFVQKYKLISYRVRAKSHHYHKVTLPPHKIIRLYRWYDIVRPCVRTSTCTLLHLGFCSSSTTDYLY